MFPVDRVVGLGWLTVQAHLLLSLVLYTTTASGTIARTNSLIYHSDFGLFDEQLEDVVADSESIHSSNLLELSIHLGLLAESPQDENFRLDGFNDPSNYKKEKISWNWNWPMMLLYAAGDLGHDPYSLEEHLTGI